MTGYNEHIDALIARYFAGEASAIEEAELQTWREADPENENFFRDMEFVFYAGASIKETRTFDVDAAWNKIAPATINQQSGKIQIGFWRSFAFAASILLIAVLGYFLVFKGGDQPMEYAATEEALEILLPDSSEVTLSPGSKLVALSSEKGAREYRMEGAGRFKVEHSDVHPFVLHQGDLEITDLGTEFTVEAFPENDTVRVKVFEGKVGFRSGADGVELVENESAIYLRSKEEFQVTRPDIRAELGSFNFESRTLGDVVEALNAHFTRQVVLDNPALAACRIDVKFTEENLDAMIEILALTLQLETIDNDKQIIIKGDACN